MEILNQISFIQVLWIDFNVISWFQSFFHLRQLIKIFTKLFNNKLNNFLWKRDINGAESAANRETKKMKSLSNRKPTKLFSFLIRTELRKRGERE